MNLNRHVAASLVVLGAMIAASLWALMSVPADVQVAVHFNYRGEADRFASPLFAFSIMPSVALIATVVFAGVPRLAPRVTQSQLAYTTFWYATIGLFLLAHIIITAQALGFTLAISRGLTAAVGLFLVITGNVAGKVLPNAVFGVRTPWTQRSERVWTRTHRLYGWLSVITGLGLIGLAIMNAPDLVLAGGVGLGMIVIVAVSTAYSYWSWHLEKRGQE